MSLKKLNLNSMKVAQPLSEATLNLLDNLANLYSKDIVDSKECCTFDEELNDERDEIIDIEVTSEFKTITDMATQTKEEIKDLGFEVSFIYFCMKIGKNDAEIMDRCSITKNRLNKAYDKLIDKGYIKHNGYTLLQAESGLNVPQNEPSEVIETVVEKVQIVQTREEIIKEQKEMWGDSTEVIFPKKNDEILNDLYQSDYKNSHSQQNHKGDVFNYTNKDRAFDFEKEEFPKNKIY